MRIRLAFLVWLVTAIYAGAQVPVYNEFPPSTAHMAEILFNDGTTHHYPVVRISKDLIRVRTTAEQSTRIPLTFVNSVKFGDGSTLFFENGEFRFDKLVQPAFLKNESGDVLLEGVLQLSKAQAESLMGPEAYGEYRKNNILLQVGVGTITAGTIALIPYASSAILESFEGSNPLRTFKDMNNLWKGVTIGGGCVLIAGAVIAIIGNSRCNRVIATYNDGLGVAYTF